jgi:hypothetical protein
VSQMPHTKMRVSKQAPRTGIKLLKLQPYKTAVHPMQLYDSVTRLNIYNWYLHMLNLILC